MSSQHNIAPGPIAPENNPPIRPLYYQPRLFFIEDITTGPTTLVTTTYDHDYVLGQQVRLLIPVFYGCQQINDQTGFVISIPAANQVVLDISSLNTNPFIANPVYGPTPPQIIAIGDINSGAINSSGRVNNITYIPGSFINISPN